MSRYEDIEQRLADWLEEGPIAAPGPPITAALAYARAHPRGRWSAVGHWRTLMSGTNMAQVGPKAPRAGWLYAAAAVLVIVVVVAGGYGILQGLNPASGVGGAASPAPTATAAPEATAASFTGSETCETLAGTAASTTTVNGVKQLRGLTYDCVATSSDARLAGPGSATMNWDDYPDGTEVVWGSRVITNGGGTWRSVWSAKTTTTSAGVAFTAVFIGEGGYEGLVASTDVHVRVEGGNTFAGTIMPAPPKIAGHETCVSKSNGTESVEAGFTAYRGVALTCTDTMADPRLSGTGRNEVSIDMRADESADIWGRYVLTNDAGTWEGYWAGTVDEGYTTHHVEALLVGTGDYEGLIYRMSVVTDATDTGYDLTGLIVPRP